VQDVRVVGRVVRDPARRPVAGQRVVLHAMTRGGGGPVDSTRTDGAGRFGFTVRAVDSGAVYVVSALFSGIAHFSDPIVLAGRLSADFGSVIVYDTSSTGPPITVALRYVSVGGARGDGTHEVIETIELENRGTRTRLPAADTAPVWQGALPAGVVQWQMGESDVSADAVSRRGDSVAVFAPLAPGGTKQVAFAYVTPATMPALRLLIDQPVAELLLLVEDTTALVTAPGLTALPVQDLEGRRFARYRVAGIAAGAEVVIGLPASGLRPQRLVPWIVGAAALALAIGLVIALRKPRTAG
jgi:hypothetical protein